MPDKRLVSITCDGSLHIVYLDVGNKEGKTVRLIRTENIVRTNIL